ncbi:MAG TPA: hypothetical protein VMA37_01485 [Acetobacteraceae bacterium]|nr:hypothetical protein [Acetobacteraceae bacterium]
MPSFPYWPTKALPTRDRGRPWQAVVLPEPEAAALVAAGFAVTPAAWSMAEEENR